MTAITFQKRGAGLELTSSSYLSPVIEDHIEGATQTYPAGSPVVLTGGYIVAAASPATDIYGFAVEAGHNVAAGAAKCHVIRVTEAHEVVANLLEGGAANHTIAITDIGSPVDLIYDANLLGTGLGGWYFDTPAAAGGSVIVTSLAGDQVPPSGRGPSRFAEVGDINARVRARVLTAVITG